MLKFQAVAEKTAKNFRGLLFAAPCMIHRVAALISGSAFYKIALVFVKARCANRWLVGGTILLLL